MADVTQAYFNEETLHTAIKHRLFKSVYESCISISSSFNNVRKFIYLDLYAGCGKFNDANLGSPLMALSCSKKQI